MAQTVRVQPEIAVGRGINLSSHLQGVGTARLLWAVVFVLCAAQLILFLFSTHDMTGTAAESLGWTQEQMEAVLAAINYTPQTANIQRMLVAFMGAATYSGVGLLILWLKPGDRVAVLGGLALAFLGASFVGPEIGQTFPALQGLLTIEYTLSWTALFLFLYVFPDGHFALRGLRWLAILTIGLNMVLLLPGMDVHSLGILLFSIITGLLVQLYRYRRVSTPEQRGQTKIVVFGLAMLVGVIVVHALIMLAFVIFVPEAQTPGHTAANAAYFLAGAIGCQVGWLAQALLPLSIAVAILRHRLWGVRTLLNWTFLYSGLGALVIGLYVAVVGTLSLAFQANNNLLFSLVATGLIAVTFQPLRNRLQRLLDRLMFGERDDPYGVLARLGERLETIDAPDAVLSGIVETVAGALRLPYAAIEYDDDGIMKIGACYGQPTGESIRLPLVYQAETVGHLIVAPRAPGESFNSADQSLLANIARQAGAAVHAAHLNRDLQQSRQRLVAAREEERRRLRRDLHDGLGPTLAAHTLKIGSARALFAHDPATADKLLTELEGDIANALADIRRLVYNLRPPALDQLGLAGAIRDCAAQYGRMDESVGARHISSLQITFDVPSKLPPLPAAVEVAAYRIVQEAVTNVVRHAQARTCTIQLKLDEGVELTITDDGVGLPAIRKAGVGLSSMYERATELGGTCLIESLVGGGTRVAARLPLPEAESMPSGES